MKNSILVAFKKAKGFQMNAEKIVMVSASFEIMECYHSMSFDSLISLLNTKKEELESKGCVVKNVELREYTQYFRDTSGLFLNYERPETEQEKSFRLSR